MSMSFVNSPVPQPALDAVAPPICREIYGMPAFVSFAVSDVPASRSWYTEGLDFIDLFSLPGPDGKPVLVHLRRWQFQDILIRPADQPPQAGNASTLSIAAVYGELDALARRARSHGGGAVDGPADSAWNTRDLVTRDPDGNTVVFTAPLPPDRFDQAFSERISEQHRQRNADHPEATRSDRPLR